MEQDQDPPPANDGHYVIDILVDAALAGRITWSTPLHEVQDLVAEATDLERVGDEQTLAHFRDMAMAGVPEVKHLQVKQAVAFIYQQVQAGEVEMLIDALAASRDQMNALAFIVLRAIYRHAHYTAGWDGRINPALCDFLERTIVDDNW